MKVEVTWSKTESFTAVIDLDDEQPWELDGDSQVLVDLEELNAVDARGETTFMDTTREVEEVRLLDASLCHFCKEPVLPHGEVWLDRRGISTCVGVDGHARGRRPHAPLRAT